MVSIATGLIKEEPLEDPTRVKTILQLSEEDKSALADMEKLVSLAIKGM